MKPPVLSLLYVSGDRPDRASKALDTDAHGIILDLEDAVVPANKARAREAVEEIAPDVVARKPVQVRVNAPSSPWGAEDLAMLAGLPAEVGIRLPKAEDVQIVGDILQRVGKRDVHLLIESALGVERAFELAQVPGVASLGLGEADLKADLGVSSTEGILWARSRIVNAARAAGLPSPLMAVFTNVKDAEGLEDACGVARSLGFLGGVAIHPRQVAIIHEAFRPTEAEVERARLILERAREGVEIGVGALQLSDGSFLDRAIVRNAQRIIALA